MNQEVKVKWLEALRSGEYRQGTNYLRNFDDTFCCLGVLCDLAAGEGIGKWNEERAFIDKNGDSGLALPTQAVVEWAGLTGQTAPLGTGDELTGLNDTGSTFDEIGNLIEAHL